MLRYLFGEIFKKEKRPMLNVGDRAPDFEVKDQTGKTHRSKDYAGKRFVLWFYPKADTPG
jgi:peroxiredoxin Q/BCP